MKMFFDGRSSIAVTCPRCAQVYVVKKSILRSHPERVCEVCSMDSLNKREAL